MRAVDVHPRADLLDASARSLLGVRFRPQGRDRDGCDCIGLALQTAWGAGLAIELPAMPLRGLGFAEAERLFAATGCRRVETAQTGDLLIQAPAALQLHLAVKVADGIVEAHAGLRRVVLRPLHPDEQWHSAWRLPLGGS